LGVSRCSRGAIHRPDGSLHFTTSNREGRGEPSPGDDLLLRIVPRAR
jgi:hypothetical protein